MTSWSDAVKKARKCRENADPKKRVACLKRHLTQEGDPWYMLQLAVELEEQDRYKEAYYYAEQVVRKLPKKEFRAQALAIAERCAKHIERERLGERSEHASEPALSVETLHIVICTNHKFWDDRDEPVYTPAKEAYTGESFKNWLQSGDAEKVDWLILSAKYGFIEPEHPVGKYDVAFAIPETGPISEESLKNQVAHQDRPFRGGRRPLKSFGSVYVHCRSKPDQCATDYCECVRAAYCPFKAQISCDCSRVRSK